MMEALDRHEKIALQFSGGRDSLAVLYLMRPYWSRLTVYYTDSGDAYPETSALVAKIAEEVPRLEIIKGRQFSDAAWPSDVVPANNTPFAINLCGQSGRPIVDRYTCCYNSIMVPMHLRMKADGVTLIIRGQKNADRAKGPLRSGMVYDGFEFLYPIEQWTDDDVTSYLLSEGVEIPTYYREGMTSAPDCLHCTAWLEHGAIPYLRKHHPKVAGEVEQRLSVIRSALLAPLARMEMVNGR